MSSATNYKNVPEFTDPIERFKLVNGYKVISLDLGTARSDASVATGVIAILFASHSTGSAYSIKLFSAANDAISETVFQAIGAINNIEEAEVFVTNTAQVGKTLTFVVLTRT